MTWKRVDKLKCKCSSSLMEHIKSPTAHRVASISKRLLWVGVVLGATIGCLITISDRIIYLRSGPTATTISAVRHSTLTFPAVTLCNLNNLRVQGILEETNLTNLVEFATLLLSGEGTDLEVCNQLLESVAIPGTDLGSITFEELVVQASQPVDDFIQGCFFAGEPCGNISEVFEPVFTNLGICYTFNSGRMRPLFESSGTGQRQGLQLVLNIDQLSNSTTILDIGLMIAVNSQSEPPLPGNLGIGVPAGRNVFISFKQKNMQDQTKRNCSSDSDISNLMFLQGDYTSYSESACLLDCMHTTIADNCECIGSRSFYSPDTARHSQLPNCALEKTCCILNTISSNCNCPRACSSILYETTVSYSSLPSEELRSLASALGLPSSLFPNDFLTVSAYFETLNVESETTSSVYSFIALLSDIGGQVGLFLGLSVISVLDFGGWVFKTMRSHDLSAYLKKIKDKCSSHRPKHSVTPDKDLSMESETKLA